MASTPIDLRQSDLFERFPLPGYIWHLHDGDEPVFVGYNRAAVRVSDGQIKGYVGAPYSEVYGDNHEVWRDFERCIADGDSFTRELDYPWYDGTVRRLRVTYVFIEPHSVFVFADDITEEREARQRLERALKQRELLVREVHHRVKNGLQVVISLLASDGEQARNRSMLRAASKVHALAALHACLYRSTEYESVVAQEYLGEIGRSVQSLYRDRRVSLRVALANLRLKSDIALSVGLIVHELLNNCYEHAFPDGRAGHVELLGRVESGHVRISVRDDGVGIDLEAADGARSGLDLVAALVESIGGGMRVDAPAEGGTRLELSLPV